MKPEIYIDYLLQMEHFRRMNDKLNQQLAGNSSLIDRLTKHPIEAQQKYSNVSAVYNVPRRNTVDIYDSGLYQQNYQGLLGNYQGALGGQSLIGNSAMDWLDELDATKTVEPEQPKFEEGKEDPMSVVRSMCK